MPESLKMLDIVLMSRSSCLKTKKCNEEEIIDDLSQSVLSLKLEKGKQKQTLLHRLHLTFYLCIPLDRRPEFELFGKLTKFKSTSLWKDKIS